MKIYALVGDSGTGKSYNSNRIAAKYKLDYIIDDGILICKNKIVEGSSAKKEASILAATRKAIFHDDENCTRMKAAIKRCAPGGILILGTSVKMVERIQRRLELPAISKIIMIEDIATEEEIAKAKLMRTSQGKHVIPVPIMEIRKTFSGYFLDPLRVFRKNSAHETAEDKSIVRPTYSYLGEFEINDTVLCTLAAYEASRCEGVDKVTRISLEEKNDFNIVFNIEVTIEYGTDIRKCSENVINAIKTSVEKHASVYTDSVNLTVKSLSIKKQN